MFTNYVRCVCRPHSSCASMCRLLPNLSVLTCTHIFVGWRITGMVTSCSATLFTRTQYRMRPNSAIPNWVRLFPALNVMIFTCAFGLWLSIAFVPNPWVCLVKGSLNGALHRSTGVASSCTPAQSFPPCNPEHLYAPPPSCGDVLQVGVAGRLH